MQEMNKFMTEGESKSSVTQFSQPPWLSSFEKLLKLADITLRPEDYKNESISQDAHY